MSLLALMAGCSPDRTFLPLVVQCKGLALMASTYRRTG